jgi:hypothetical protein
MDQAEVERFKSVAAAFFAEGDELKGAVVGELERATKAIEAVAAQLERGGAAVIDTPEVKAIYDDARAAQRVLYERNWSIAIDAIKKLVSIETAAKTTANAEIQPSKAIQASLAQTRAMGLDSSILQFYWGMAFLSLHASIGQCTGACEKYLGRKVGSHDVQKRVLRFLKVFGVDLAGVAVAFCFLPSIAEAVRQLKADPAREGAEAETRTSTSIAKVVNYRKLVEGLTHETEFAERITSTSVEAVRDARMHLAQGIPEIRQALYDARPTS